jgi:hypothetical protein
MFWSRAHARSGWDLPDNKLLDRISGCRHNRGTRGEYFFMPGLAALRMRGVLIGLAVLLAAAAFLLWAPEWMANQYRFDNTKDWAAQVAANRTTLVNLLGGLAVGVTIYFTYQNFKVAQDNLAIAQGNLKITQDKLSSETFSKAVEQLGSEATSTRLGGHLHSGAARETIGERLLSGDADPHGLPARQALLGRNAAGSY